MDFNKFKTRIEDLRKYHLISKKKIKLNKENEIIEYLVFPFLDLMKNFNISDHYVEREYPLFHSKHYGGCAKSIDLAIINKENNIIDILIEVKRLRQGKQKNKLSYHNGHIEQINEYFYFCNPKPTYVLLTNGEDFWFYADFVKRCKIDNKPFLKFNIVSYKDEDLKDLHYLLTCKLERKYVKRYFNIKMLPFSNKLRDIRKSNNFTAKQLGQKVDLTEARITSIERSEHVPQLDTANLLANALGVTVLDIFPPKDRSDSVC